MELELHQLERRYERLRKRHPPQERQLLASLAEIGQQLPIAVVGETTRYVVIDGYKRVPALKRLSRDMVRGTRWEIGEIEASHRARNCVTGSGFSCQARADSFC